MSTTKDQVLNALKAIIDPDFNKDIVSLGFIKDVTIDGGKVSVTIELTTPACPVKDEFEQKAKQILSHLPGVKEVAVQLTAQQRKPQSLPQGTPPALQNVQSIIAVSSCKGGVGKSTIAAQMAQELARRGFKTGLVDIDIHGPSIPTLFNLHNIEIFANAQKQIIPIFKNGLKIMSFGFLLGDAPAVMRGPIVSRYVQEVLTNTAWGELDYLFVDMPPGTGDVQLTVCQQIRLSGAIIVTTPHNLSLLDVARGILMFEKVNVPILGVVENMAFYICDNCDKKHFIFGQGGGEKLKERFGIEVLGQLPILPQLTLSIQEPLANEYIMQTVDSAMRALGKRSILQTEIPQIQFDDKEVTLTWPDGTRYQISNRELRLSCRCALCANELTGEKIFSEKNLLPNIAAKQIAPLGNYALSIAWNDGHASGIYPYETIKSLTQNSPTSGRK